MNIKHRSISSIITDLSFLIVMLIWLLGQPVNAYQTQSGDNPHGLLDYSCNACHSTAGWGELRPDPSFSHNQTEFPLEGQHRFIECIACHESLVFSQAQNSCTSCHTDIHEGQFANECERCHSPSGWDDEGEFRRMHQQTRFPLAGVHSTLDCGSCHESGEYATLSPSCEACHYDTFLNTREPDHSQAGFSTDCEKCHGIETVQWNEDVRNFEHTQSFPLSGGHNIDNCQQCHLPGEDYSLTPNTCFACHDDDFANVNDPDHGSSSFSTNCEECHTTSNWSNARFDHTLASFALSGAHLGLACNFCHSERYTGTPEDCYSCHEEEYRNADEPDHVELDFDLDCTVCHSTLTFDRIASFDHEGVTGYVLDGAHQPLDCSDCHNNEYSNTPEVCLGCHQDDFDQAEPIHQPVAFDDDCSICHNTVEWEQSSFDHLADAEYPLEGGHADPECADCHIDGEYLETSVDCYVCHRMEYEESEEPNHVELMYPTDCSLCHEITEWEETDFDHDQTNFPLLGAHRVADCSLCHEEGYVDTPLECIACHEQEFQDATQPIHNPTSFSEDCQVCHGFDSWSPSSFNHDTQTDYVLTGAHVPLDCSLCHSSGQYADTPDNCYACHQDDYQNTNDPNHVSNGYSQDCTECHSTDSWSGTAFDHSQTDFPLTGAHDGLDCMLCHSDGFAGTPSACFACHQSDFSGADNPIHQPEAFDEECTVCHSTEAWIPSTFNHDTQTDFLINGSHVPLDCSQCHIGGEYLNTESDCYFCHQDDYESTTDPDHAGQNYPLECTKCHNTQDWEDTDFDHDDTEFPLTGEHRDLNCFECHSEGFEGTPTECYACHQEDYEDADDPDHVGENYPRDCSLCHNTSDWDDAEFDHDQTDFPLTGAHEGLDCALCHSQGYADTPVECFACHEEDFNGVADPNHLQGNYPHDCTVCHTVEQWQGAEFDHDQTDFPLTGAHAGLDCGLCHSQGYEDTPTACFACHEDDFNDANDPVHQPEAFNEDCTVCHTTNSWSPSNFNHNNHTDYDLVGQHTGLNCALCHQNGQYLDTPDNCFFCHEDDYNGADDPNHLQAGFPTECETCHTPVDWDETTFDHDDQYFPIYRGSHREEWDTCSDCHLGGNVNDFSCTHCHRHRRARMDDDHDEVNGYVWESHACFECHPDGREDAPQHWSPLDIEPKREMK